MERIGLKKWLLLESSPIAFLPILYWICTANISEDKLIPILAISSLLYSVVLLILQNKKEVFDELARENLFKAESICLKFAYCFIVITLGLIPILGDKFSLFIVGYIILGELFFLATLRVFLFSYFDTEGLK